MEDDRELRCLKPDAANFNSSTEHVTIKEQNEEEGRMNVIAKNEEGRSCLIFFVGVSCNPFSECFQAFSVSTNLGQHITQERKSRKLRTLRTGIGSGCSCVKVTDATLYEARSGKVEQNHIPVLKMTEN